VKNLSTLSNGSCRAYQACHAEGKEVAKSKGKKLRKEWERQKKLHEAFIAGK
jgi:hypothetical protein